MFIVKTELKQFIIKDNTLHTKEREKRLTLANNLIIQEKGKIIKIYVVNKGHANGDEIHVIYNNGIIKIYNANTGKYITCLIARLPQITRYGIIPSKTMEKKIKEHIKKGYNNI